MKKIFTGIILPLVLSCNPLWAQTAPVKGKGQAQSTFQTVERLQTKNSSLTVTGDKAVLFEGDKDNLLDNPSFEHQTYSTGWTLAGTPSVDTGNYYDGIKSASISLSSFTGDIATKCVTPTSQQAGLNLEHSMRVKTTLANLQVCAVQGTTEGQCTNVSNVDQWILVPATSTGVSGQLCVKLKSTGAVTGTVKIDDAYLGKNRNIGNTPFSTDWADCSSFSTTWTSGTTTSCKIRRDGPDALIQYRLQITGGVTATQLNLTMPNGLSIDTSKLLMHGTSGYTWAPTSRVQVYRAGDPYNTGLTGIIVINNATTLQPQYTVYSSPGIFPAGAWNNTNIWTKGSGDYFIFDFRVPIVGWDVYQPITVLQMRPPTVQIYNSGSGTYVPSSGVTYITVKGAGGGAGGGGGGTSDNVGPTNGGNTTFGTSLLTANGGNAAAMSATTNSGGSYTVNSPAIDIGSTQGGSGDAANNIVNAQGGGGGSSCFGGGGGGGLSASGAGTPGPGTNTGGGGGGAGSPPTGTVYSGAGGGGGGCFFAQINNPSASGYPYSVGAAGVGGSANGTGNRSGSNGSAGKIVVTEYYGANIPLALESTKAYAKAYGSTQAVGTSAAVLINPTVEQNVRSLYNPATGLFTCDKTMRVRVQGLASAGSSPGSSSSNRRFLMQGRKNGANANYMDAFIYENTGVGIELMIGGSTVFDCVKNDTLEVTVQRSADITAFSLAGNSYDTYTIFQEL